MKSVLFTAAHSGFNLGKVPLGGGAAICYQLAREWNQTKPFEFTVLGPSLLKDSPLNKDLVQYSELEYARFCRDFEKAVTARILEHDPKDVVVLCNDVSEGPDFRLLAQKGYSLYTIYHVDVVDYFTTIYLRALLKPETTTKVYRFLRKTGLSSLVPDVLKLVWDKQEASVLYSKGLIVPSRRMKDVLLKCYPELPASRVHVLPWGIWGDAVKPAEVDQERLRYETEAPAARDALKLLLLSRISPEKGQHRLLEALALWEKEADFPAPGVWVYLSGEAAYMMGKTYERKLKKTARQLKKSTVRFVGYAAGAKKKALFKMADIYVFPSIHESYGLTMMEAIKAGLPVLSTASYGALEIYQQGMGEMITAGPESEVPRKLMHGLKRLWAGRDQLTSMGAAGARWAANYDFSRTASTLAALLASQ